MLWDPFQCVKGVGVHTTNKQFSDTSMMSKNSAQFWHYLPRDSARFHGWRTVLQDWPCCSCQSQVQVVTGASNQVAINQRFPRTPSSGVINLLEGLTELRETFLSLDYCFIIKGYNSKTATWMSCTGQGLWEGPWRFSFPSRHATVPAPHYVHQPGSSLNSLFWGF